MTKLTKPIAIAIAALAVVSVSACTAGGNSSTRSSASVLTIAGEPSTTGPFTKNFNPFSSKSGTATGESGNLIYEPLLMNNYANNSIQPWLAKSYTWSKDGKSLTMQLQSTVTWADGQKFSASDVAFTFNLLKKYPALNLTGIPIASAEAQGSDTVVLTFTKPAFVFLGNIGNTTPVPEHVWSKVSNPVTYADPKPVGTGPYELSQFNSTVITLKRNPSYWNSMKPKIQEVRYLAFDSQSSELAALETGKIQWASLKLSSGVEPFVNKDPAHNKVLAVQGGENVLTLNLTEFPFNQLAVRKAVSQALNRQNISKVGQLGVNPPATSPTGLNPSIQADMISQQYRSLTYPKTGDISAAKKTLEAAGYTAGSDGIYESPDGKPVEFEILCPSSSTAFIRVAQLMATTLKKAGISVTVKSVSGQSQSTAVQLGKFQAVFSPSPIQGLKYPYFFYQAHLDYALSAPIGKVARADHGRFKSDKADALLNQMLETAPGSSKNKQALYGLEDLTVQQVPVIPVFDTVWRAEYSTKMFTGWPTKDNMYVGAEAYWPSAEVILLHLQPAQ